MRPCHHRSPVFVVVEYLYVVEFTKWGRVVDLATNKRFLPSPRSFRVPSPLSYNAAFKSSSFKMFPTLLTAAILVASAVQGVSADPTLTIPTTISQVRSPGIAT